MATSCLSGRMLRKLLRAPTSGTKRHGTVRSDGRPSRRPHDELEPLPAAAADRHDEPAAGLELLVERRRQLGRGGGDGDRGERRVLGQAERAVADVHVDGPRSRPPRGRARALGELRDPLDRVHLGRELGEHRRLVAGARADVEHPLVAAQRERLADARDHVRLRDRLLAADRQRGVVVGASRCSRGTKSSRGTRAIAASTRSSSMPRARSCRSTIACGQRHARPHEPALDPKCASDGGRDVGDALGSARRSRPSASARSSRPRRASRGCRRPRGGGRRGRRTPSPPRRRRAPRPRSGSRARQRDASGSSTRVADRLELGAGRIAAPRRRAARPPRRPRGKRRRRRLVAVERSRELAASTRASGAGRPAPARFEAVTTMCRRARRASCSSRATCSTRRLPVVGAEHDRVALEELVRAARRLDAARRSRRRSARARVLGAGRAERVRRVVEVREVVDEEVEAVARDEPASDRRRVRVDRAGRAVAHGERRAGRPTRTGCRRRSASARTRGFVTQAASAGAGAARGST